MNLEQPGEPCSPGCRGWGVFLTFGRDDGDREEIERCDKCAIFEDDNAAEAHVLRGAALGDARCFDALIEVLYGNLISEADAG